MNKKCETWENLKKGKPNKHQKSVLVKIKLMYDKWEEYL